VGVDVDEVDEDKFTFTVRAFLVEGATPVVAVDVEDVEGGFEEEVGELKEPVKLLLRES
jgi:hypothetical protein